MMTILWSVVSDPKPQNLAIVGTHAVSNLLSGYAPMRKMVLTARAYETVAAEFNLEAVERW